MKKRVLATILSLMVAAPMLFGCDMTAAAPAAEAVQEAVEEKAEEVTTEVAEAVEEQAEEVQEAVEEQVCLKREGQRTGRCDQRYFRT